MCSVSVALKIYLLAFQLFRFGFFHISLFSIFCPHRTNSARPLLESWARHFWSGQNWVQMVAKRCRLLAKITGNCKALDNTEQLRNFLGQKSLHFGHSPADILNELVSCSHFDYFCFIWFIDNFHSLIIIISCRLLHGLKNSSVIQINVLTAFDFNVTQLAIHGEIL